MIYRSQIFPLDASFKFWGQESEVPEGLEPCFDSRKYEAGKLFWCLCGERFDGFAYVESVLEKSCPFIVFQLSESSEKKADELAKLFPATFFLGVPNSESFLQELAAKSMETWKNADPNHIVISLTGSNGKTTTKEMLVHLAKACLGDGFSSTVGNLNNHIGVPMTILSGHQEDLVRIIEMGTNHPGEIDFLTKIARPDTGIITCIGDAHLEFFKDRDGVFKEKSSLYRYVKSNGRRSETFVVNGDDEYLQKLNGVRQFSFDQGAAWSLELVGPCLTLLNEEKTFKLTNRNILGRHNFKNLAAAFALMFSLFPQKEIELIEAASSFKPSYNRSSFVDLSATRIFLDAYNANPSSMTLSLKEYLSYIVESSVEMNKVLFVMGDMNELGEEESPFFHEKLGKLLGDEGGRHAIFVGRFAASYVKGFEKAESVYSFPSCDEISPDFWKSTLSKYEHIFIKGSRSLALEQLLKY